MAGMLLFLGYAMIFGLMRGVKVRTAYAVGEGRPGDAVRYAQAGALLGAAAGVALWAVSRDVTPILSALGLSASMVPAARDFVAARSWGAVGTCAGAALIQYLQGMASFLPGVAVAEAASVLVARSLGERRIDEADRVTRASLALGIGFMTACGVVFALFGAALAGAFADEAEVIRVARRLFLVAAVFQTLDAVNMILRGALRGAKDVRGVAVIGITVAWLTVPVSAYVFGRLCGLGAMGGWIGFVFETTVASSLLWRRWSRGRWRAAFHVSHVSHASEPGAGSAPARSRQSDPGPARVPALAG